MKSSGQGSFPAAVLPYVTPASFPRLSLPHGWLALIEFRPFRREGFLTRGRVWYNRTHGRRIS